MLFNFGKCKCIYIGHGNMDEEYKMGNAVLGRSTQEKDSGVTFSTDMKVSEQCAGFLLSMAIAGTMNPKAHDRVTMYHRPLWIHHELIYIM